jgi:hypothetical protein
MEKKYIMAIVILTLAIRLILAFSQPEFTHESYFHLRHVEHITETGLPLFNDPLSYQGRELIFLPLFHYLAAFFNLFLPLTVVAKILPNLLLAMLPALVYLISKPISRTGSLIAAGITGFLPSTFQTNSFTPDSLFLPLIFLAIYAFMNHERERHLYLYVLAFFLASFTSSATFLLVIGFGIYLLLSVIEKQKIKTIELELILASLFFYIWSQFLFFNNTLITEGVGFIWQNVPSAIRTTYFPKINIAKALLSISIIPFITGIIVVYRSLFQKRKKSFLAISLAISTALLAAFKLIQIHLALAFFGIILAILFPSFFDYLLTSLRKTKVAQHKHILIITIIILLIPTTVFPAINTSLSQPLPSNKEIQAFKWLESHTPPNSTIISSTAEGHMLTFYGHRKNIADDQFSLIPDVEQRFVDQRTIFKTQFSTAALAIFEKYDSQYIILTPTAKEIYGIPRLYYLSPKCFHQVYNDEVKIYQTKCLVGRT